MSELEPLFSDKIQSGDFVGITLRTPHGQVKFHGTCTVSRNIGAYLIVMEYDKIKQHHGVSLRTFKVKAVDVQSGHHQLEWWGKTG